MANRIVGNCYIIDSQTGAANALISGTSSAWLDGMYITGIAFWAANTTNSAFELVFANATDTSAISMGFGNTTPSTTWSNFGEATNFKELRCKTLTAGTGYIYFK